jgi:hypothetical protein
MARYMSALIAPKIVQIGGYGRNARIYLEANPP